ncbi:histidyl-tRNA synthetase [Thermoplasmatales archaeon SG8-52-4]|nr:MAG: histidyl-tRNA synthetase [Thermoplasmatales archaeon SG8-52-4]
MFKIPRGTRDFSPEEMQKRNYIEKVMRNTFETFGYREIQTPSFETLELFTAKSGETILEEIYSFTDKGGRNLALRPELTAPVIRFYVEKLQMEPKPLKLFYIGNCYRYDRPQKGRYREFKQAGCEIIGTETEEAYAELIALAYKILENAGVKNLELKIGNLNILSSIFDKFKLSTDQKKYLTPLIDKSLFEDIFYALRDFSIKNEDANILTELLQTSDIKKIDNIIDDETVKKELLIFKKILTLLKESFNISYEIKLGIVRGLDYYKGIVFEIEAPLLGAEKQLCGGGAYELVPLFGGKKSPTAGFAIGFDRTIVALESEGFKFPNPTLDVYVVPFNEDMIKQSLHIVKNLRNLDFKVDIDLLRRGLSKSLKYANSINAKKIIIVGPQELEKDSVTIKDMKTGEQVISPIKDIGKLFK